MTYRLQGDCSATELGWHKLHLAIITVMGGATGGIRTRTAHPLKVVPPTVGLPGLQLCYGYQLSAGYRLAKNLKTSPRTCPTVVVALVSLAADPVGSASSALPTITTMTTAMNPPASLLNQPGIYFMSFPSPSLRAGSNRWPAHYECAALPTELQRQLTSAMSSR